MKKTIRKFEAIPVAEVLKKVTEVHVLRPAEKAAAKKTAVKKEPYAIRDFNRPGE